MTDKITEERLADWRKDLRNCWDEDECPSWPVVETHVDALLQSLRSAQAGGCRQTANSELLGGRSPEVKAVAWQIDGKLLCDVESVAADYIADGNAVEPLITLSSHQSVTAGLQQRAEVAEENYLRTWNERDAQRRRAEAAEALIAAKDAEIERLKKERDHHAKASARSFGIDKLGRLEAAEARANAAAEAEKSWRKACLEAREGCNQRSETISSLRRKLIEAETALNNIRELNMTGPDEHGHRWANSDLIEQEIVASLSSLNGAKQ